MKRMITLIFTIILLFTFTTSIYADTKQVSLKSSLKAQSQSMLKSFYSIQNRVASKRKQLNTAYLKVKDAKLKKAISILRTQINSLDKEINKIIAKAKAKEGSVRRAINRNDLEALQGLAGSLMGMYDEVKVKYNKEEVLISKGLKLCVKKTAK